MTPPTSRKNTAPDPGASETGGVPARRRTRRTPPPPLPPAEQESPEAFAVLRNWSDLHQILADLTDSADAYMKGEAVRVTVRGGRRFVSAAARVVGRSRDHISLLKGKSERDPEGKVKPLGAAAAEERAAGWEERAPVEISEVQRVSLDEWVCVCRPKDGNRPAFKVSISHMPGE